MLGALGLGHLVAIGVVDGLEKVLLEAGEFGELLVEPLDLLLEVDMSAELEEDAGSAEVGDAAAFGHFLLVTDYDNIGAFT